MTPTATSVPAQTGGPAAESLPLSPEDKRRRQAQLRAARAVARAAARAVVPERSSDFDHLTLPALRVYRQALVEEEDRVSYWRRILQARLDMLRAGAGAGGRDMDHLRPVLTEERVNGGRQALVTVVPADDVPPLPDLARLWELTPAPGDDAAAAALEAGLVQAEQDLSRYRAALHVRLDAATTELIARYHGNPLQCLAALPTKRGMDAGARGTDRR